jgi:hypothetical protein
MKNKLSDSGIRKKVNEPNILINYTKRYRKRKRSNRKKKIKKKTVKHSKRIIIDENKSISDSDENIINLKSIKKVENYEKVKEENPKEEVEKVEIKDIDDLGKLRLDDKDKKKKHKMKIKRINIQEKTDITKRDPNIKKLLVDPELLDKVDKKKKGQKFSF